FSIKTNSLSRDKLSSYFYEVQNIHYGDILTKYDAILDVCNKELPSIIGSTISDFADALLSEGDIVFADAAEDSTVGKAIEVRNFKGKNVVSGLHTIVARPKVSYAPYYLGYLINSTAYHNQILPLMQGTKVSSISKANLKSTTVVFPTLPEQEAIGSFFSDLDQLITLHQRKLDDVKELKKALLQKMFPKGNGNDFPELRFPEFTDAWKQRKLGEFMKESKILGSKGDIARKLTVRLWGRGVVSKKEIYSGSSATQYYIRKSGQFIYGKLDFLNQAFGIIPPELDGYESTLDSPAFDLLKGINGQFLLEFVSRKEFYYYQGNIANGSRKAKRIHTETFLGMPISLPTLPEQEAIGSFFSDLDQLITLHQRQLDHLKLLKKALLQQMFI
ncbi:restriction endonuclease subunit S, partial [Streptococcus suis]|nr:restriction endonuclease subunit S [Streptococcus suis]